jgi:hypothetical protein
VPRPAQRTLLEASRTSEGVAASRPNELDGPKGEIVVSAFEDLAARLSMEMDLDVPVNLLPFHRCSVCGQPARTSVYDLNRRHRTLLCGTCPLPSLARG